MDLQEVKKLRQVYKKLQNINETFELRIIPALERHNANLEKLVLDTEMLGTLVPIEKSTGELSSEQDAPRALQIPEITTVFRASPARLEIPVIATKIHNFSPTRPRKKPSLALPELMTMKHTFNK